MAQERKVDVAIIGAGTAGLSAFSEVQKVTDSCVLIHGGPYGTTCARLGCMPSKVLIQVANDFHRRQVLAREGILGTEALQMPFYHPVVEEGLQTALRDLSGKIAKQRPRFELARCESPAVGDLS